ncbi:MAG TPA: hypothetical protein VFZ63_11800 [Jiangellaceae bacterium]
MLNNDKIQLSPFADTGNPGGVYILAICSLDRVGTDGQVSPRDCKYDAFKVREGKDEEPPPPLITLSGIKYYDANTNGQWDAGEPGLSNWPIDYTNGQSGTLFTDANGNFTLAPVLADEIYTLAEQQANAPWFQTGNTVNQTAPPGIVSLSNFIYTADLTGITQNTDVTGLNFGNVCVVPFDGRTPGFWQNPNGQALIDASDLQVLRDLHLVWPDGSAFDPLDKSELIAFNSDSDAQNMASQLSWHLAAVVLNVRHGFVDGNAVIFGDGRTVNQLIADADASLAANPVTTDGHPERAV